MRGEVGCSGLFDSFITSSSSPCVQEALKEQETSLKKLENEKQKLIEENFDLKSTGDVLAKISQVQEKASEQLETANTKKDPNVGSEIASIDQV